MLHRGNLFLKRLNETRGKIAKLASPFILDGSVTSTSSFKIEK